MTRTTQRRAAEVPYSAIRTQTQRAPRKSNGGRGGGARLPRALTHQPRASLLRRPPGAGRRRTGRRRAGHAPYAVASERQAAALMTEPDSRSPPSSLPASASDSVVDDESGGAHAHPLLRTLDTHAPTMQAVPTTLGAGDASPAALVAAPSPKRARFAADRARRHALYGGPDWAMDEALLAALPDMPPCAGIALGFDRLAMLAAGVDDVRDVIFLPR